MVWRKRPWHVTVLLSNPWHKWVSTALGLWDIGKTHFPCHFQSPVLANKLLRAKNATRRGSAGKMEIEMNGLTRKWKHDSLKSLFIRLGTTRRRRGRKELYAQVNFINPAGSGDRAGGSSRRAIRTSLEESCETEGERESESKGSNTGERAPSGAPDGLHYPLRLCT